MFINYLKIALRNIKKRQEFPFWPGSKSLTISRNFHPLTLQNESITPKRTWSTIHNAGQISRNFKTIQFEIDSSLASAQSNLEGLQKYSPLSSAAIRSSSFIHSPHSPPGAWYDTMDRIRVSCRKTSVAALPHSRDSVCVQSRTSDFRSRDISQRHPGSQAGNSRTLCRCFQARNPIWNKSCRVLSVRQIPLSSSEENHRASRASSAG